MSNIEFEKRKSIEQVEESTELAPKFDENGVEKLKSKQETNEGHGGAEGHWRRSGGSLPGVWTYKKLDRPVSRARAPVSLSGLLPPEPHKYRP